MSGKLPDGWFNPFPGDLWRHSTGAAADLHRPHGNFRAAVYGPDRTTKEEAEQDRLNLISGLDGGNTFDPDIEAKYIRALAKIIGLRKERDRMRSTIEKQQCEINNLKSATPQLLRDSMRVTQEESARLKADMARKDAEIASLRQRVAASEAYTQHLLAALNAVSGFKGPQ